MGATSQIVGNPGKILETKKQMFLLLTHNGYMWDESSFYQLGNSGNTAISVKGKGITNVKMYVERKDFS